MREPVSVRCRGVSGDLHHSNCGPTKPSWEIATPPDCREGVWDTPQTNGHVLRPHYQGVLGSNPGHMPSIGPFCVDRRGVRLPVGSPPVRILIRAWSQSATSPGVTDDREPGSITCLETNGKPPDFTPEPVFEPPRLQLNTSSGTPFVIIGPTHSSTTGPIKTGKFAHRPSLEILHRRDVTYPSIGPLHLNRGRMIGMATFRRHAESCSNPGEEWLNIMGVGEKEE